MPFNNQRVATISRDTANIYPKDYTLFSLWLLNGVAMLHGFNENGSYIGSTNGRVRENVELLDTLLKAFTSNDISEQNLRVSLLIIQSLLLTWWPKKCELVMSFWECFHKKLNSTFFVSGAAPSSLAVAGYVFTRVGVLSANIVQILIPTFVCYLTVKQLLNTLNKRKKSLALKSQIITQIVL